MPITASLPMTWTATMVSASHWVGLTLPGMMEEPGSFSGMKISPSPHRGPEASQRTSLAIFMRFAARAFKAPWEKVRASLAVSAWNLLGAVRKGRPVSAAAASAAASPNPAGAFSPVPTAVPPRASSYRPSREARIMSRPCSTMERQPLISCPKVMGTASCKWVRPVLTMPAFSCSSRSRQTSMASMAGKSRSYSAVTAAMCRAVGKVSLELWDMFTWSLGCSKFSPALPLP